jgi:hypothetical protein
MSDTPKITFIGGGNMASAIIGGMISSSTFLPSQITVTEPSQARCDQVKATFPGINSTTSNTTAVSQADLVLIAVKPHIVPTICREVCASLKSSAAVFYNFIKLLKGCVHRRWSHDPNNLCSAAPHHADYPVHAEYPVDGHARRDWIVRVPGNDTSSESPG